MSRPGASGRGLATVVRLIAALLFAWQAIIAQAHVHAWPAAPAPTAAVGIAASTAPQRPDSPLECPVCREVAHAGQYLSPTPILFAPPVAVALALAVAALPTFGGQARSHAWRSRAPPVPRQS